MKLIKALILTVSISILGLLFSSSKSYAAADITLKDNKEEKSISVIVNSNEAYMVGINVSVIFSNNVNITKVTKADSSCAMSYRDVVLADRVNIECVNNAETVVNGEIVKLFYNTASDAYSFYIDKEQLDTAGLEVGNITEINRPTAPINAQTQESTQQEINTDQKVAPKSNVSDFIRDNTLLLYAVGITFLIIIITVAGFYLNKRNRE